MRIRIKIPRLGKPHLAVAAIVVVALLALITFAVAKGITGSAPPPASVATDVNGTSSSDIEYIPVPPGSSDIKPEQPYRGLWKGTDYQTQMRVEDIFQWYKAQLPSRGWTLEYEIIRNSWDYSFQGYYWSDKQDKTPYVRKLDISIMGMRDVTVSLYRVPITDRVPLYPGAQDFQEKKWQPVPRAADDQNPWTETVISFRVKATRQTVEDFYKNILAQYGWVYSGEGYDASKDAHIKGSLLFGWEAVGSTGPYWGDVTLIANERDNGWTYVELHLMGDNKYFPIPFTPLDP